MENRPPQQEPPRRPPTNNVRKTDGSGGSPTPPWLWLLLLGGFGLIFYQFVPKAETSVGYYPWFYEQVQNDNIRSILPQGTEIRGELRKEQDYQSTPINSRRRSNGSLPLRPRRRRPKRFFRRSFSATRTGRRRKRKPARACASILSRRHRRPVCCG